MWHAIFNFTPSSLLFVTGDEYLRGGKQVPFDEFEMNRLRAIIPIALTALLFDSLDAARIGRDGDDIRNRFISQLLAALSLRSHVPCRVGSLLIVPPELELAKKRFKPGFFSDVRACEASEEEIARLVIPFRSFGFSTVLRQSRGSELHSLFASQEARNFRRFEVLALAAGISATGVMARAERPDAVGFLTDVFIPAQRFYDEAVIPAFRAN